MLCLRLLICNRESNVLRRGALGSLILDRWYATMDKNRDTGKDTIIHEEMSPEKREEILRKLEEESKNLKEWIE